MNLWMRNISCSLPGRENSRQTVNRADLGSKDTQDGFFRGLDVMRVNVKGRPIMNRVVIVWRDRDDSYVWSLAKYCIADARPFPQLVLGNDDDIRVCLLYTHWDIGLIRHFADNFDVRLI